MLVVKDDSEKVRLYAIMRRRARVWTSSSSFSRRYPIYCLWDCSASMAGEPIAASRQGTDFTLMRPDGFVRACPATMLRPQPLRAGETGERVLSE